MFDVPEHYVDAIRAPEPAAIGTTAPGKKIASLLHN